MAEHRLLACIGPLAHAPKTRHLIGLPGRGGDLMPPAEVVLMEIEADGTAQVYRFTLDGDFAGDTWHESRQDAEDQLEFEYGNAVGPWVDVPPDVDDAQKYAVTWARIARPEA